MDVPRDQAKLLKPVNLGTNASLDVAIAPKFGPGSPIPTESPEAGGVGGSRSGVPWENN
jgi:hypothetical protein